MGVPNLNSSDYYEILGCPRNADEATLKKAYRKAAVKWHPDKNPDNEEATKNFQKVSEAFATLSDPKKRQMYDQYGEEGARAADQMGEDGGMPGGFGGGFGGAPRGGGGGAHHMSQEEAAAFFASAFGGGDPFGGMFGGMGGGGGGHPGIRFSSNMGGSPFGGGGFGGGGLEELLGGMGGSMRGGFGQQGMGGRPGMGGMRQQSMPTMAKTYDVIPPGTIVSLKDLVSAADHNGDRGVIKQYIPSSKRYVVEIEDSDETLSVKPENLLQHVHVRIQDIQSQPELNGQRGTIITWCPKKGRYNIYVSSKVVSLKPNNVILENGTVARVTGLESRPELNGKWGTVKGYVRDSNKYDVQLSSTQIIRVKVENMIL
jgi:curved DNA-binding protein CbpA